MGAVGSGFQAVAAAGTAEALSATRILVQYVVIYPLKQNGSANTGNVVVGESNVSIAGNPAVPAAGVTLRAGEVAGSYIDLSEVFVDAANNDDAVVFWYVKA